METCNFVGAAYTNSFEEALANEYLVDISFRRVTRVCTPISLTMPRRSSRLYIMYLDAPQNPPVFSIVQADRAQYCHEHAYHNIKAKR